MKKRIIIAEDDNTTRMALTKFLEREGFAVEGFAGAEEALSKFKDYPSEVVITDLEMPGMHGSEFIDHIKGLDIRPAIIVTSSHKDPDQIINIMKKGVYDYIIKPVDFSELLLRITRAFEQQEMKHIVEVSEKEKIIRLESSLEWYKFADHFHSSRKLHTDQNLFDSLLTSLNQGPGFGSLITLIRLISDSAEKQGNNYIIDGEIFEAVKKNVEFAEKGFETFSDISNISDIFSRPEEKTVSEIYLMLRQYMKSREDQTSIRNHSFKMSDLDKCYESTYILIDPVYFIKAFHEIFINALKFSPGNTDVLVLFHVADGFCTISVLNEISTEVTLKQGIPMGYENMVFEPFYRISKVMHEQYGSLDYGLGLTLAEKIISKHKGKIAIHNINDHSDFRTGVKTKVECSIAVPLAERHLNAGKDGRKNENPGC